MERVTMPMELSDLGTYFRWTAERNSAMSQGLFLPGKYHLTFETQKLDNKTDTSPMLAGHEPDERLSMSLPFFLCIRIATVLNIELVGACSERYGITHQTRQGSCVTAASGQSVGGVHSTVSTLVLHLDRAVLPLSTVCGDVPSVLHKCTNEEMTSNAESTRHPIVLHYLLDAYCFCTPIGRRGG